MADPIVWPFFGGGDYTEELAWLTDVMQSPAGGTQHRRLRELPRTTLGLSVLESGARRRWMEVLLRAHSAAAWWVPVSIDVLTLSAPAVAASTQLDVSGLASARHVVGGRALLIGDDVRRHEIVQINALSVDQMELAAPLVNTWPAGTQVVPLRRGRLAELPQLGRFTSDATTLMDLRFQLDEGLETEAAIPGALYRDLPVFDFMAPVWTSDPNWVPERLTYAIDNEVAAPFVVDTAGVALGKVTMQYAAATQAEAVLLRSALFALAGRWSPVWVPNWAHDLLLVANVSGGATTIDVEGPLLSTQPLAANHRDIRIELHGGAVYYRRITARTAHSSTVDRLTLGVSLPSAFTVAQVKMISFLTLSVQDSDTSRLRYFDRDTVQCELTWRELAHGL